MSFGLRADFVVACQMRVLLFNGNCFNTLKPPWAHGTPNTGKVVDMKDQNDDCMLWW
jgi:hypothetical protein